LIGYARYSTDEQDLTAQRLAEQDPDLEPDRSPRRAASGPSRLAGMPVRHGVYCDDGQAGKPRVFQTRALPGPAVDLPEASRHRRGRSACGLTESFQLLPSVLRGPAPHTPSATIRPPTRPCARCLCCPDFRSGWGDEAVDAASVRLGPGRSQRTRPMEFRIIASPDGLHRQHFLTQDPVAQFWTDTVVLHGVFMPDAYPE